MATHSATLAAMNGDERHALEQRLLQRQTGKCFICDKVIDSVLHDGQLDIDHIVPLTDSGPDEENNFALTHLSCNRSKGASDLRVARRMAEFERFQEAARDAGERGANHLVCSRNCILQPDPVFANPSSVIAWAGWDHLHQDQALAASY